MEVEEYLSRSRLYRRLRSGPYGQLVERYAARLVEERLVRLGMALPQRGWGAPELDGRPSLQAGGS
jgi:hypothetical protein